MTPEAVERLRAIAAAYPAPCAASAKLRQHNGEECVVFGLSKAARKPPVYIPEADMEGMSDEDVLAVLNEAWA